jgi:hypothetical protein
VGTHAAREEVIERARITDGEQHPHSTSMAKKIPASDWESSWLYDYFAAMPPVLSGNYYRWVMWIYMLLSAVCVFNVPV